MGCWARKEQELSLAMAEHMSPGQSESSSSGHEHALELSTARARATTTLASPSNRRVDVRHADPVRRRHNPSERALRRGVSRGRCSPVFETSRRRRQRQERLMGCDVHLVKTWRFQRPAVETGRYIVHYRHVD